MIEIQHVTKRFRNGVTAVNDFSISLDRGVIGLLGPNGAGKTTLMQMIAAITRPSSGFIQFEGEDITVNSNTLRKKLGYLPQDFGVYDNLTAFEFLNYIASLKGVYDKKRIARLLELVNLHGEANRPASGFSGGMRQRLGIAQALVNDPEIVIVDEPTAGLDPEERLRFRNILSEIGAGKLVILSTHIVSDVEAVATRIVVMNSGRLVAFASSEDLLCAASGHVWETIVPSRAVEALKTKFKISRTAPRSEGIYVRLVHPDQPDPSASPARPDLEEAFLYSINFHHSQ